MILTKMHFSFPCEFKSKLFSWKVIFFHFTALYFTLITPHKQYFPPYRWGKGGGGWAISPTIFSEVYESDR